MTIEEFTQKTLARMYHVVSENVAEAEKAEFKAQSHRKRATTANDTIFKIAAGLLVFDHWECIAMNDKGDFIAEFDMDDFDEAVERIQHITGHECTYTWKPVSDGNWRCFLNSVIQNKKNLATGIIMPAWKEVKDESDNR